MLKFIIIILVLTFVNCGNKNSDKLRINSDYQTEEWYCFFYELQYSLVKNDKKKLAELEKYHVTELGLDFLRVGNYKHSRKLISDKLFTCKDRFLISKYLQDLSLNSHFYTEQCQTYENYFSYPFCVKESYIKKNQEKIALIIYYLVSPWQYDVVGRVGSMPHGLKFLFDERLGKHLTILHEKLRKDGFNFDYP